MELERQIQRRARYQGTFRLSAIKKKSGTRFPRLARSRRAWCMVSPSPIDGWGWRGQRSSGSTRAIATDATRVFAGRRAWARARTPPSPFQPLLIEGPSRC